MDFERESWDGTTTRQEILRLRALAREQLWQIKQQQQHIDRLRALVLKLLRWLPRSAQRQIASTLDLYDNATGHKE